MSAAAGERTCPTPRVLHVVPALFSAGDGIVGGAERYAVELARHMAGHTPTTLVTFGERERFETLGDLKIHVLGSPWYVRGQRSNPVALSMLSEIRDADVVHCHQQRVLSSSVAAVLCRLSGRRVFVTELGGGGWDVSGYISTDRWYHGHLHISQYSRTAYGHAGKSWAHVILGGVDTDKFSPDDTVKRDGPALFVGRLLPHKGVNDLVSAVAADMPLELIGHEADGRFVKDLAGLGAGKQVTFLRDCDDAALVHAYRRAMCVVLPSVHTTMYGDVTAVPELLGQTLLEGMACGTPVICTAVASMPEIVTDGVTGFVVPERDPVTLGQRLEWLRQHPDAARAMGRAGRDHVLQTFAWRRVVARCLDIYRR